MNDLDSFIFKQEEDELSENTIKQYRHIVFEFLNFLDNDYSKLKVNSFKEYMSEKKKLCPRSQNLWIIIVNKYLKFINKPELILKEEKIQKEFSIKESLSIIDYKRLLRYAKKRGDHQSYYMMKILAMTGCRISELKYFTIENLNTNIEIKSKSKFREITVVKPLLRELRKYARSQKIKNGTLFPSSITGEMITFSCFWKRIKKIAGAARVNKKKVHAHAFRHLFAIKFLEEYPGNLPQLADILGHSSIETTRIYTKLTRSTKEKMIESINFNK